MYPPWICSFLSHWPSPHYITNEFHTLGSLMFLTLETPMEWWSRVMGTVTKWILWELKPITKCQRRGLYLTLSNYSTLKAEVLFNKMPFNLASQSAALLCRHPSSPSHFLKALSEHQERSAGAMMLSETILGTPAMQAEIFSATVQIYCSSFYD